MGCFKCVLWPTAASFSYDAAALAERKEIMRRLRLSLTLFLATIAAAAGAPKEIGDRPGGLLPCEDMPGQAMPAVHADVNRDYVVPRADGQPTALFFEQEDAGPKPGPRLIYADLTTGKTRIEEWPAGFGKPWGRIWGPDGRCYMLLWYPATMVRYDPATDKVETFGVMEPEDKGGCVMTVGTDGKVYAMTGTGGHVFSIDPKTDRVVRYGKQGPERRESYAYSGTLAVDDEYIYSTFGNIEKFTVAMNKTTREQTLLSDFQRAVFHQGRDGVTADYDGKTWWMFQGKPVLQKSNDEKPPWANHAQAGRHPAMPLKGKNDEKPAKPERPQVGHRAAPVRKGTKSATMQEPPVLKCNVEFLPNSMWRDQDGTVRIWYRLDSGSKWQMITYKVTGRPVTMRRLALMPDGRLLISTTDYDGLYTYDLKTRKIEHEGVDQQSHYCTLVIGRKVYLGGYPGGNLYIWDPARPWTALKGTPDDPAPYEALPECNPHRIIWAKPEGFQHPRFLLQGSDGFLYTGIHGERAAHGGVISWCDLQGGNGGFLREPFEGHDVAGMCTAMQGSKIIYSSSPGRLFVFDVASKTIDWTIDDPLSGMHGGFVAEYAPGKLLLAAAGRLNAEEKGTAICKVDMTARKVTADAEYLGQLNDGGYYWMTDFFLGPDNNAYTIIEDSLVRIDPETLRVTRISRIGTGGSFAFVGADIYLTGTKNLRRVPGVLKTKGKPAARRRSLLQQIPAEDKDEE